jgi:hypothetical protein
MRDEAAGEARAAQRTVQASVTQWYAEMVPCWLGITPTLRRHLVLHTHQWIVDSVFARGGSPALLLGELGPGGALTSGLVALVPENAMRRWQPWIRLMLHDLRRALASPPMPPTEAWCRWLFLIPYSIPVRPRSRERLEGLPLPLDR